MSKKFLESFGGKLAEKWIATLLTPAFVFWVGGAAIAIHHYSWKTVTDHLKQQPQPLQIAILVSGFCLIAASAFVVQRFELSILKFLEGYWPRWMRPIRRRFLSGERKRIAKLEQRWQALAQISPSQFTPEHQEELVQLDWKQHYLPLPHELMPTCLGNILRAMERRPLEKYGLDAVLCWSRLCLLLPDNIKKELAEARAELNNAARTWLWSILFTLWGLWAIWGESWALLAIPLGLVAALFSYHWAIAAAITYSDLIEATFDLYRHLLYEALRWRLPEDPNEERRVGQQLNQYLWRGEVVTR